MFRRQANFVLQKRVTTIRGLRPWNTNRSGAQVMRLARDPRKTTVVPTPDVCVARQRHLRTQLTTLGRELAEMKLELRRTSQSLHTCSSLNEQLNDTVLMLGMILSKQQYELQYELDAVVPREQRHADLLRASEIRVRRTALEDNLRQKGETLRQKGETLRQLEEIVRRLEKDKKNEHTDMLLKLAKEVLIPAAVQAVALYAVGLNLP